MGGEGGVFYEEENLGQATLATIEPDVSSQVVSEAPSEKVEISADYKAPESEADFGVAEEDQGPTEIPIPDATILPIGGTLESELTSEELLCESLLGFSHSTRPVEVVQTLLQRREQLLAEYDIPSPESFQDKAEYDKYIIERCRQEGFEIVYVGNDILRQKGVAAGVNRQGQIVVPRLDADARPIDYYYRSVRILHEYVHKMNEKRGLKISKEEDEFRAFLVANLPSIAVSVLNEYPESSNLQSYFIADRFFSDVKSSVDIYKEE